MQFRFLSIFLFVFLVSVDSYGGEIDSLKQRALIETDKRELGKINSRLGWLHILSDPTTAGKYIDTAITYYREIGDSSGIANSWYRIGVLNRFTGDFERAHAFMDKSLSYYSSQSDTVMIVNALYQKGAIYNFEGRYNKSLEAYFSILEVYESLQDSVSMGFTLNGIGIVFKNMRKYDDARKVYERAISIHRAKDGGENLANALSNLGGVYAEIGNHEKALDLFREAKEIDEELGIEWGIALNEKNIGTALFELKQYEEALSHLLKARKIESENGYIADLAENAAKLGLTYLYLGLPDSAETSIRRGLMLDISSHKIKMDLYQALSEVLEVKGAFSDALEAKKMQSAYQDSIFNETNAKMANIWAAEYGIKEKDDQLAQKDQLLEERDSIIDQMETRTLAAIGAGAFALVLALIIWLFYRQQQKLKNEEIQNLQKQKQISSLESYIRGEENERKRLARDLHDGLNGDLSVVKYKVSSLDDKLLSSDEAQRRQEAIDLIDRACEQVRSISHNLAPQVLKEFSLKEAIEQFISRVNSASDIAFSFLFFGENPKPGLEKETVIFRMIQEIVNNIVKHSDATEALVQFNRHDAELILTVEDNGKGFDREKAHSGMGLKTIRSRIDYLNAECEFTSSPEGTTYVIHVPLSNQIHT